jgi:hypothetical protein
MLGSRKRRVWIGVAALILAGSRAALAGGGPKINIDYVAGKDGTLKVFNTDGKANVVGAPIISLDLSKGQRAKTTVTGTMQDLSTQFTEKVSTKVAALDNGIVIPDPANPGKLMQANLAQALAAHINIYQPVTVPVLGTTSSDIFSSVDLVTYFNSGGTPPPPGTTVAITNGTSSSLPGMMFGLSPITFDPSSGYVNSSPFTGDITLFGTDTLSAVPEPTSIVMLVMGVGVVTAAVVRSRRTAAA